MTFHIIPWMWGVDGDKTVGISDTVRITADGCESFFTLDEDFVVKPDQGAAGADRPTDIASARSKAASRQAADPDGQMRDG